MIPSHSLELTVFKISCTLRHLGLWILDGLVNPPLPVGIEDIMHLEASWPWREWQRPFPFQPTCTCESDRVSVRYAQTPTRTCVEGLGFRVQNMIACQFDLLQLRPVPACRVQNLRVGKCVLPASLGFRV
jgi:hypothetical protein